MSIHVQSTKEQSEPQMLMSLLALGWQPVSLDSRGDEPWQKAGARPEPEALQPGALKKTEAEKRAKNGTELRDYVVHAMCL